MTCSTFCYMRVLAYFSISLFYSSDMITSTTNFNFEAAMVFLFILSWDYLNCNSSFHLRSELKYDCKCKIFSIISLEMTVGFGV